jgi:hypothetical protein
MDPSSHLASRRTTHSAGAELVLRLRVHDCGDDEAVGDDPPAAETAEVDAGLDMVAPAISLEITGRAAKPIPAHHSE